MYQISEKEWNKVQKRFKDKNNLIESLEFQLEEQIQLNERLQNALENSEDEIQRKTKELSEVTDTFKRLEILYLETINSLKCKLYSNNLLKNSLTIDDLED